MPPPKALPWYPDKLAWQLNFTRANLRKLPWLSAIHEFMKVGARVCVRSVCGGVWVCGGGHREGGRRRGGSIHT